MSVYDLILSPAARAAAGFTDQQLVPRITNPTVATPSGAEIDSLVGPARERAEENWSRRVAEARHDAASAGAVVFLVRQHGPDLLARVLGRAAARLMLQESGLHPETLRRWDEEAARDQREREAQAATAEAVYSDHPQHHPDVTAL